MTTCFEIDQATNDLVRRNGSFVRVDSVVQRVFMALQLLQNEWFLARDEGLPLYEEMLGHSNIAHVRQLLVELILGVEGVVSLDKLNLNLNRSTRVMTVTFAVNDGAEVELQLGPKA